MKTLSTTILLSVMFLSAGAFAGVSHKLPATAAAQSSNVTIAVKNQSWPLPGRISVEPCPAEVCIDI